MSEQTKPDLERITNRIQEITQTDARKQNRTDIRMPPPDDKRDERMRAGDTARAEPRVTTVSNVRPNTMQINKTEKMAQYSKNEPGSWKRRGFTKLPTWALHDKRLGRADILVLAALSSRAFKGKEYTFPSLTTITKESRYSRKSVIQAIKNLEACGYITVIRAKRGSRKTNRYRIIWRDGPVDNAPPRPPGPVS